MYSNNFKFITEKAWLDSINTDNFEQKALSLYAFQYENNTIYKSFVDIVCKDQLSVKTINHIPFLPIHFFKTHVVSSGIFNPEAIFESSGTTQTINSQHHIKDLTIYQHSFIRGFEQQYGAVDDYVWLCLLPSYLERSNSSLVYMAKHFIEKSKHSESGFYLHDFEALATSILQLQQTNKKVILLGVTFALLDFAAAYPMPIPNVIIMETGGMKGRKEEWTKQQVHDYLKQQWQVANIHAEYGMTELMSQAYSKGAGVYKCAPTMQVLIRDVNDPFEISQHGKGALNIIDLSNIYSCAFIATDDIGIVASNKQFQVAGRLDFSALRGCSLMTI